MTRYPKKIVKVEIGKSAGEHLDLTAIEYAGERPIGTGPGEDMVAPKIVLNTFVPSGVSHYNKLQEILIGLREDEYLAMFGTPVSDSLNAIIMDGYNPEIGYLAITWEYADGTTETKIYSPRVAGVSSARLMTEEGKYTTELKFICPFVKLYGGYVFITERTDYPLNSPAFSNTCRSDTWGSNGLLFSNACRSDTWGSNGLLFSNACRSDNATFNAVT